MSRSNFKKSISGLIELLPGRVNGGCPDHQYDEYDYFQLKKKWMFDSSIFHKEA